MMSLAMIREMSDRASRKAKHAHRAPWVAEPYALSRAQAGEVGGVNIPMLGDYVPPAWERTERDLLFVDSSGFGSADEPAMSMTRMFREMSPGLGYAVVEAGQFQVYVAEYRRKPRSRRQGVQS